MPSLEKVLAWVLLALCATALLFDFIYPYPVLPLPLVFAYPAGVLEVIISGLVGYFTATELVGKSVKYLLLVNAIAIIALYGAVVLDMHMNAAVLPHLPPNLFKVFFIALTVAFCIGLITTWLIINKVCK